jgi:hypothetical protein
MPNHHFAEGGDPEKTGYGYETNGGAYEEPFVHGHATIAEAAGTGGATHRGLKSRHIQFLYVLEFLDTSDFDANGSPGLSVVLLELVCSSDQAQFLLWSDLRLCSWLISA